MTDTANELRETAASLAAVLARRDELIRAMRDQGSSLRAIAAAAGLSHPGVLKILNNGKDPQ